MIKPVFTIAFAGIMMAAGGAGAETPLAPSAAQAAAAGGASGKGSCVTCHATAGEAAELKHTFSDWEKSVHGQHAVGCEACHGGDAANAEKTASHKGLLASGSARSKVYFTNIPATCGSCHAAEYAAFKQSRHHKELMKTGKGPNCVTCHGAMASHILDPRTMEMTCTLCHRRPTKAFGAVLSLNNAKTQSIRLAKAVEAAKAKNLDVAAQERESAAVVALVRNALAEWHTFKMPEVIAITQEAARRAVAASNELKLKGITGEETR